MKSSINIQPIKPNSEVHNTRQVDLDYVRNDLSDQNESLYLTTESLPDTLRMCKDIIKQKTGRAMQKKAAPIREGVFLFKEDTTMEDVKRVIDRVQNELKGSSEAPRDKKRNDDKSAINTHELAEVRVLQVHLHRDEGHYKTDEDTGEEKWEPNLHGHMIFDFLDKDQGKSIKWTKQQYAQLQTIFAEELGLERGVSSDKRHIASLSFKNKKLQEESKNLFEIIQNKNLEIEQMNHDIIDKDQEIDEINCSIAELTKYNEETSKELWNVSEELGNTKNELSKLKRDYGQKEVELKKTAKELTQEVVKLQNNIKEEREFLNDTMSKYKPLIEHLNNANSVSTRLIAELKTKNTAIKEELDDANEIQILLIDEKLKREETQRKVQDLEDKVKKRKNNMGY